VICVCGWCGKDLGHRVGPVDIVTHGICDACKEAEMAKISRPFSVSAPRVDAPK